MDCTSLKTIRISIVKNDDDDNRPFEDEDEFDEVAPSYEQDGYKCYYFGETGDGPHRWSMRTGRTTVDLGGENFTFYFETSGGDRGAGVTGEQDNRYYQSGKLLSAGTDERFQVVQRTRTGTDPDNGRPIYSYTLLDDVDEFIAVVNSDRGTELQCWSQLIFPILQRQMIWAMNSVFPI